MAARRLSRALPLPLLASLMLLVGASASACGRGVAVFDFDGVLKTENEGVGEAARYGVKKAREMGYGIAILSRSGWRDYKQNFLHNLDPQMLRSDAFMVGRPDKGRATKELARNFGTCPACCVLFDDSAYEAMMARAGAPFIRVSNPSRGLSYQELERGLGILRSCA